MLHGDHIKSFIEKMTKEVVEFLNCELEQTEVTKQLTLLLLSWQEITRIISKTSYKNQTDYELKLIDFKIYISSFKSAAEKTIYASQSGDDIDTTQENFYCHVLTEYMDFFIQDTYKKYKLGTGIFSMQGFERRNKESKNCAKRFYNNRFNITISTLLRLFDLFFHGKGAY